MTASRAQGIFAFELYISLPAVRDAGRMMDGAWCQVPSDMMYAHLYTNVKTRMRVNKKRGRGRAGMRERGVRIELFLPSEPFLIPFPKTRLKLTCLDAFLTEQNTKQPTRCCSILVFCILMFDNLPNLVSNPNLILAFARSFALSLPLASLRPVTLACFFAARCARAKSAYFPWSSGWKGRRRSKTKARRARSKSPGRCACSFLLSLFSLR